MFQEDLHDTFLGVVCRYYPDKGFDDNCCRNPMASRGHGAIL